MVAREAPMFSHRLLQAGTAAAFAFLAMQGPALAAGPTRYAAPGGSALGLTCDNPAAPCTLAHALQVASVTADEVVVAPGDYALATPLTIGAASNVHGADGQPRPVIHGSSGATPLVTMGTAGATLRHVVVRQDGGSSAVTAALAATPADVALQNSTPGGSAASLGTGAVLAGSTALESGGPAQAIDIAGGPATLHNVTAWASGGTGSSAIRVESGATLVATNTIARAPGGSDLSGGGLPTMIASNFDDAPAPLLANPGAGDFHELAGSPTIDAGLADPVAGLTDIDGQ